MIILVRNLTYGFYGKNDHIFTVNKNDTLSSLKEKIIQHFKTSESIDIFIFDNKTCLTITIKNFVIIFPLQILFLHFRNKNEIFIKNI